MGPLAADVPSQKRRSTLEALLVRVQARSRGAVAKPAAPPPPAPEKIDAFDDRWGSPPKPPIVQAAPPPPPPAPEKIDAFDDRWGSPPKPPIVQAAPPPPPKPVSPVSGDRAGRLTVLLQRILDNGRR